MRALCVKNPWAALIAAGRKTVELRTWETSYRGPVVIISSAKPSSSPEARAWPEARAAPGSRVLAVVELLDVRPAKPSDATRACCQPSAGEFAWCLQLVRRVKSDEHIVGKLSLFRADEKLLSIVQAAPSKGQLSLFDRVGKKP